MAAERPNVYSSRCRNILLAPEERNKVAATKFAPLELKVVIAFFFYKYLVPPGPKKLEFRM